MEKTFHFVDGIKIGKDARARMKSHVMKGKNAGKKIHRRSRLGAARRPHPFHSGAFHQASGEEEVLLAFSRPSWPTTNARLLGNPFLTFSSYPVQLTAHSLRVIDQFFFLINAKMFPLHFGITTDQIKSMWLGILAADEAGSHCALSLMEAFNRFFTNEGASSPEALHHLSMTFSLVNKRLKSAEALSDSTLGIILMLVIQEQIRQQPVEAEIHFDGLRKMIELRGGLPQFEENPLLLLKVCKIDMSYALQYGRPTHYFRDRMSKVQITLASQGFNLDRTFAASEIRHSTLDAFLYGILLDVTCAASIFNSISMERTIDSSTFQEMIISIGSRLLRFESLQPPKQMVGIEAVYHIGLTIFNMTAFLQYDCSRILSYGVVSARLRAVLDATQDQVDNELLLWLVFIGGIWISSDTNASWLITKLKSLAQKLSIDNWAEARSNLTLFPWINAVHDRPGRSLWDLARLSTDFP